MGKGDGFERDNDRALSLWWSNGKDEDIFWRTSGSGSRATARMKKGKTANLHAGDVTAINPIGKTLEDLFLIEQKTGYSSFGRISQKDLVGVTQLLVRVDLAAQLLLLNR